MAERHPRAARPPARPFDAAPRPPDDGWVQVHPTPTTMLFREALLGELGYTEGQGVYNVVRSSEAVTRQLQAAVFGALLNAAAHRDLEADWRRHVAARRLEPERLVRRYGGAPDGDVAAVAERVYDTWRAALRASLLDFARGLADCFAQGGPGGPVGFSRYIDWLMCLGLVPVMRRPREGEVTQRLEAFLSDHALPRDLATVAGAVERAAPGLRELARAFDSARIADYDRVCLFYHPRRGEWRVRDPAGAQRGECVVLWPPLWTGDRLLFDSPMQRLSREIVACRALREHARVCRLRNAASVKVLLGRKNDGDRGAAGAARAVSRALGEDDASKAGSAASRLVRLIINMKGMRHIGDINDTVRAYLDEAGGHLIDSAAVDPALPGFGRATGRPAAGGADPAAPRQQQLRQAFQTSVVNNINGMLEGYINNLFGTIERLRETNTDLATQLRDRDIELRRARLGALDRQQRAADPGRAPEAEPAGQDDLRTDYDIIDVSKAMDDDTYVANSFQHQYVPSYAQDLERLSRLWEHELLRCFKISRHTNNQGRETAIFYSSGAIALFVAPYFASVLRAPAMGALITGPNGVLGEEELWEAIFKKTRVQTYLTDLAALFVADVRHAARSRPPAPEPADHDRRVRERPRGRSRSPVDAGRPGGRGPEDAWGGRGDHGHLDPRRGGDGGRRP
ncbi:capsid portal protein [Macacine alphaherpesvirus 1]|nr:capsid portal protein [Macacine alphaherpesvirus 1]ARS02092.1 capsid portal protein [Macacine alphaherpesvirus 1]ARS02167.1 capsid portal protein [Macacine alphaherpesvirus 1]ARS02242.1 capsid portal protein [Macacine alphaherpesvirus 1]ARS02317.1 capsid portal protein [Macacine alphaherpesvirus 1]